MQKPKLKPSIFFIQFFVSVTIVATFNLLVVNLSKNSVPRRLLLDIKSSEAATELFLGNSLIAAGVNTKVFEANLLKRKAINLGLGFSSPVEHYLLLKSSMKHHNANIYYGFFDTQLTDKITSDYASLFGNRAASYYIEPEAAISLYASNDLKKELQLRLIGKIPMLVERAAIWANVERMRRHLGEAGMPSIAVNQFGRNEDFKILEPSDGKSFAQNCENVVSNKIEFNSGINSILELVKKRNRRVIFVLMPMTKKHRDKFYSTLAWSNYKNHLNNLIKTNGASLIDASDWVEDNGFSDGLHLNKLGANLFSQKIAGFNKIDTDLERE